MSEYTSLDFGFGDIDPLDAIDASDLQPRPITVLWLDGMADRLRAEGLIVVEVDGWQRRSRSNNSGYARVPTTVMVHHTASDTTPENDVNYMTFNSEYAPIANLFIARNGVVYVMAGGPTNTNGQGEDDWGGGVPDDSMNSYAIGIEIGNTGVGEVYPWEQINSTLRACKVICEALDLPVSQVRSHFEWTPRKIDPSGEPYDAPQTPDLQWDMEHFRRDVKALLEDQPQGEYVMTNEYAVLTKPTRLVDSRDFGMEAGRVGSDVPGDHDTITITIPNWTDEVAVETTITLVDPRRNGYATVWDGQGEKPVASCVNTQPGIGAIANTTSVALNGDEFTIFIKGDCHILVDLVGVYFAR